MERKSSEKKQSVVLSQEEGDKEIFSPSWENTTGFFPKIEDGHHLQEGGA